ncbi:galactose-6-phosphate isomerase subunit LacA [Macrococcoides caseolyticum]|uniref:galactose-6-phosphate isomerase subunit LacA n=1 Tax=Macrococcoides caseolyticum TaxID=69966 RepID=UPI000A31EDCE|nr:galactose-6-phosphate isomerase subunit LacA [Macrococcus caseolyticus]PKE06191.1 galactose-6-phosphate isomerase subunit LacA [Macrococcus caseolyticus]PKE10619.1 galactose-6-phosphate isomerase subunit LacA [Macrococcus caseolyticus]PKE23375.1 galactose-6-phosphate isomerase subunit LacA [Macrococcus caseolyticus]PKE49390.1 galactose-6-phosphate isomerase subunit LacA [Macrococcus caseolyticus]PKE52640.1 galactose-6-phosphate isomerase subunit LacA [Macrococcus caseolyticus]
MNVIIGADQDGQKLKNIVQEFLLEEGYNVFDVSSKSHKDFIDTTLAVASMVQEDEDNLGIMIDAYGAGSFMVATKIKGMIAAEVSDERSAYMTRGHNDARMITMGSEIVGAELALNIVNAFVTGKYDGGRHQIRVDMLNKMA